MIKVSKKIGHGSFELTFHLDGSIPVKEGLLWLEFHDEIIQLLKRLEAHVAAIRPIASEH